MKLWLVSLAASASSVSMAAAQTVPDPEPGYGLPNVGLKLPAAAASSVASSPAPVRAPPTPAPRMIEVAPAPRAAIRHAPAPRVELHREMPHAAAPTPRVEIRREVRQAAPLPHVEVRRAPAPAPRAEMRPEMRRAPVTMHVRTAPHHREMRGADRQRHGRHHSGWTSIRRGGFVPGFWAGRQFVVRNWGMYGFPQPFHGGRWIRYHDDALLVDRYGRVHDGRYGWDWDRYGDHWADRDGVPVYVGDGDYEPGDYDYEWAESWDEGGEDMVYDHGGPPPPGCRTPCSMPYSAPHPGYGGYGGYGYYGYSYGPIVVTETITTTTSGGACCEQGGKSHAKSRHYRKRVRQAPPHHAPPPPPYHPGERG